MISALIAGFVAIAAWEGGKRVVKHVQQPFRYDCPDCHFRFTTSSHASMVMVSESHVNAFHPALDSQD